MDRRVSVEMAMRPDLGRIPPCGRQPVKMSILPFLHGTVN